MVGNYFVSSGMIILWQYKDDNGNVLCWAPNSKRWTIGSRIVSLTEIGAYCKISEDELLLLKLKYGG